MRLNIAAVALVVTGLLNAQSGESQYPNTYSSGSSDVERFTQSSKRYNDWSVSIGGGLPLVQSADLTSIKNGNGNGNGKGLYGYSAYISIDKAITHVFGISLQYDRGETRQGDFNTKTSNGVGGSVGARTQYDAISILGDINFSNLLRRVDNNSPYRWALHGYAGVGTLGYRAYQESSSMNGQRLMSEVKPFAYNSIFGQAGAGLKYKISRRVDIEGRVMYVVTRNDEFDGGGNQYSLINLREEQVSDDFLNATLGIKIKLGKYASHLMWHDPLQELYYNLDVLSKSAPDVEVCKKGDHDNDGVCDDWDRELSTPSGARVDGSGVSLDVDLDGVIDLYDKCVTVPGSASNGGCPETPLPAKEDIKEGIVSDDVRVLEGIEFDLDSDRILPSNTPILENAVDYINSVQAVYKVIGTTDTRASDAYNQKLSEKRANNVRNYLIKKGVQPSRLEAIGKGEKALKYPECEPASKCPEWKNRANRRVYFQQK